MKSEKERASLCERDGRSAQPFMSEGTAVKGCVDLVARVCLKTADSLKKIDEMNK